MVVENAKPHIMESPSGFKNGSLPPSPYAKETIPATVVTEVIKTGRKRVFPA